MTTNQKMRVLIATLVLAALVACESGSAPTGGSTRYLLLAHNSLAGSLASSDDATLLSIGGRACGEMDANVPPDQIIADLGGNPEPGSAQFNTYSYIVVTAATELCPGHRSIFSTPNLPN
jgi:Protein of unknown function (DUF732)